MTSVDAVRRFWRVLAVAAAVCCFAVFHSIAVARPLRVGIFSGTFDPPHVGHEALVQAVIEKLDVDVMYVIPNLSSDHKSNVRPYAVRKEMSRAAFLKFDRVKLPDAALEKAFAEKDMDGVMAQIMAKMPEDAQLFQVMGDDSFERFSKLKSFAKIRNRHVVVIPRLGQAEVPSSIADIPVSLFDMRNVVIPKVSSTEIRATLGAGLPSPKLSLEVQEIIDRRSLYRAPLPTVCGKFFGEIKF